jgi:hypothetical protein
MEVLDYYTENDKNFYMGFQLGLVFCMGSIYRKLSERPRY